MLLYECGSDAKKLLNRSVSETGFPSEASSFSFNSLSCHLSSTPMTMDHFSKMFRRTSKYSLAVVLYWMCMNWVLDNVDAMVC